MPLQEKLNDHAIAFRVWELLNSGQSVRAGDYIKVALPPTFTMQAKGEWCQDD